MPIAATIQRVTIPDNISNVLGEIDFTKLIENNVDLQKQIEGMGIPPEAINEVMHSEVVGDIVEMYAHDVGNVIEGSAEESTFSTEAVMGILNDNIDEIAAFTRQYVPGADLVDEKELKEQLQQNLQEQSVAVTEMLPSVADLKQSTEGGGVRYGNLTSLKNGIVFVRESLTPILYAVICVLAVLIVILQYRELRGFWRTGVTFTSAGVTTLLLAVSAEGILKLTEGSIPAEAISLLKPLVQVFSRGFFTFAITYLSIGAVCMATFGVALLIRKKRRKATMGPVEQTAPEMLPDGTDELAEQAAAEQK